MKVTMMVIVLSLLIMNQLLACDSSAKSTSAPGPNIKVDCSLDSGQQTVEFKWRATNASYVLINGRDEKRHELEGKFIEQGGGAYTFVAVGQNKNAREPKACFRQSAGSPAGVYKDGAASAGFGLGSHLIENLMYVPGLPLSEQKVLTTTMSKPQLEQRLTDLFKSELDLPAATRSPEADSRIFVYTEDYTDSDRICHTVQCNPADNVRRRVGFNVLLTKISQESDQTKYRINVFADVLLQPADKTNVWLPDPSSQQIARIIANALAEKLMASMPK